MKKLKLILLTLFIFVSGLNIQSQNRKAMFFNSSITVIQPNTFIGGVGATSVTSIADFIALTGGITAANISNFQIDSNNNVSFFCDAAYTLDIQAFDSDAALTYYIDEKCTQLNLSIFGGVDNSTYYYFPNVTSSNNGIWLSSNNIKVIVIPLCTPIGLSSGDENCFVSVLNLDYVITHADNETNNGGSPDGDLTQSGVTISNIRYVTNTTPPSDISDLTVDAVFGTAIEVSWSAPSTTNAIIYYEVWANNRFVGLQTTTGKFITGLSLNTSYIIKVFTLDEFGNRGESNIINQTTDASEDIPMGNIVSYWNFNSNSNDSVDTNDGTDTSISYVISGGVGNVADFTAGTASGIEVADANSLSFGSGAFSVSMRVKWNATPAATGFFNKRSTVDGTNPEYQISFTGSAIQTYLVDGSFADYISNLASHSFSSGVWYSIIITVDGSATNAGTKTYIDGIEKSFTTSNLGTYVAMQNLNEPLTIGKYAAGTTISLDGYMDELSIFNVELSSAQVSAIKTKNDAGSGLTD